MTPDTTKRHLVALGFACALTAGARAQGADDFDLRLRQIEQENQELQRKLDALAGEVERFEMRDLFPVVGESEYGLGPAASKVYSADQGAVSIGGYGEFLYEARAGAPDQADALRVITYVGYKYNENWVFNSELEFEHGTTVSASGLTNSSGVGISGVRVPRLLALRSVPEPSRRPRC